MFMDWDCVDPTVGCDGGYGDDPTTQYPPGVLTGREITTWSLHRDEHGVSRRGSPSLSSWIESNDPPKSIDYYEITGVREQWSELTQEDIIDMFNQIDEDHPVYQGDLESMSEDKALDEYQEWESEYELSLVEERRKNSEINLHRLLSTPHEWRSNPLFGSHRGDVKFGDEVICGPIDDESVGNRYTKDRITCEIAIMNHFPVNPNQQGGYAVGLSDYGMVYIPSKFRSYIPGDRTPFRATLALSDISKERMCALSLIYIH